MVPGRPAGLMDVTSGREPVSSANQGSASANAAEQCCGVGGLDARGSMLANWTAQWLVVLLARYTAIPGR
jgi:hypothetical protein